MGERTVPKLRFKGFADEWEIIKLKDVLKKIKDGTHSSFKNTKTGPFLLSAKNIRNDQLILSNNERHISKEDLNRINKPFEPTIGDVLLTIVGTIGNTYLVNKNLNNIAFQRSVAFLRPDKKIILSSYLEDLLNTGHVKLQIKQRETLSAQPGIYLNDLSKIKINISRSSEEQAKIAVIFEKINEALSLQQQKLAQLQKLKKGFLQNLFPAENSSVPRIRFVGFNNKWKIEKLGDLVSVKTGSRNLQDAVENGKYPFFVRSDKVARLNEYDFDEKAILIPGDGRIGEIFHYYDGKFALHQRVYKVSNFKLIHPLFLLFMFQQKFKKHALRLNVQGTVPSLRLPMFTQWCILVPSNDEQQKIGHFVQKLDNQIKLQQSKIEKLKQIKKFLLQNVFI